MLDQFRNWINQPGRPQRRVGLALLIVALIGYGLYSIWTQLADRRTSPGEFTMGYVCSSCDQQFKMTNVEVSNQEYDAKSLEKHRDRSMDQPHCPHCGQKHAGLLMKECPKCGEFFLTERRNIRTNPDAPIPPPICPKCNTDYNKWHMERNAP